MEREKMPPQAQPYQDLLKNLDELRQRTARFRRVALHLHSPDSYDWGRKGDATLNDKNKFLIDDGEKGFINALKEHLDLVVITDHMKCSYASKLSSVRRREENFLILPGMEINFLPEAAISCFRLHILAIWLCTLL